MQHRFKQNTLLDTLPSRNWVLSKQLVSDYSYGEILIVLDATTSFKKTEQQLRNLFTTFSHLLSSTLVFICAILTTQHLELKVADNKPSTGHKVSISVDVDGVDAMVSQV